jgi:hypothetical protein
MRETLPQPITPTLILRAGVAGSAARASNGPAATAAPMAALRWKN